MMFANRMGWGTNGWDNGNFNGQGQQNVEVQNQLQAIRTQLQDNQNNDCVLRAITGTTSDVRQLAQQLNCDFNTLNQFRSDDQARTIQDLKNEISQLKQTDSIVAAVMARFGNNGCGCGCNNGCSNF